jgi:integrase
MGHDPLLCQTVLQTGVRRNEAVEWRTSYLPDDPAAWKIRGDYAIVRLVHGTKYGSERDIRLRLSFADEIHRYQSRFRLQARAKWIEGNASKKPPSRLFLSEHLGKPISYQVLYEAWVGVPALPFKGWSPHAGRHYWACTTLLEHLELQSQRARSVLKQMPDAWVHEVGLSAIQTIIQPQLGHASDETTERYLKWIHESIAVSDAYLGYHNFLDDEEHHRAERLDGGGT